MLIVIAAIFARNALTDEQQAKLTPDLIDIESDLFNAVQNVRLEQGALNTALVVEGPISGTALRDVRTLRAQFDKNFNSGMAKLRGFPLPQLPQFAEQIGREKTALVAACAQAEAALRMPLAQRPTDISAKWVASVGAIVDSLDALAGQLESELGSEDAFTVTMVEIKQLAWAARAETGNDRFQIAQAIARKEVISTQQLDQFRLVTGRTDAVWKLIEDKVGQRSTPPN
jgi:methyl-accepting chemotaxis protein